MPEGIYENRIAFDTADGHTHDNVNSKKIDFARYDLYDFVSRYELEQEVRRIVNEGSINPAGGITIGNPFTGGFITLGPEVPDPGSTAGLSVTAGNNPDGTSYFELDWDDVTNADHYLIEMYVSDTGTNGPYRQTATQIVDGDAQTFLKFDGILSFGLLTQTYYKFIIYPISSAGIKSAPQIISGVQASADSDPGVRPTWPTSGFNLFLMFRGFITRVNTPVEADIKYGQGQIEWSLTENNTTDGLWVTNEFQTGQQTAVVINVTGLVTGDVYYLRVRTIDTSGNTSPWSYWNGATNQGNATAPWNGGTISAIVPGKIEGLGDGSGGAGLDEIGAGSILAGNIYAGTITADRITADVELVTNQKIRSSNFNATNKTGWQIRALTGSESGTDPSNLAEFYLGAIFNDVTIENSTFKVVDGSNNTVFEVLSPTGNTTIMGTLTIGDYAGGDPGVNYSGGVFSVRGVVNATDGSFANTVLIGGTAASVVRDGAADGATAHQNGDALTLGTVGGWTITSGKISGGSLTHLIEISQADRGIFVGGGRAVMRVYSSGGNVGDIRMGIDYSGGSQPDYGEPGDITMFYDATGSGTTKFSVGDKLLFDGTNLTVKGNITASTLNIGSGNTSLNASTSGNFWTGNLTETDAPFRIKNDGTVLMGVPYDSTNKHSRIRIKHSSNTFLFSGTALEFVEFDTSTTPHGYLQGGEWTLPYPISAGVEGVIMGSGDTNYVGVFQDHSGGVGVTLNAQKSGEDIILLNSTQGIKIQQQSAAPTLATDKIYNVDGELYWNGASLVGDDIRALAQAAMIVADDALNVAESAGGGGSGTVTSVATSGAITGGTITTTGTIGFDESAIGNTGHSHSQYSATGHNHSGSYLPLSAGSGSPLTGSLYMPAYGYINFGNSGYIATKTGSNYYINLKCYGGGATQLHYADGSNNNTTRRLNVGSSSITVYKNLFPSPGGGSGWPGNGLVCGNSSNKWVDVYSNAFSGSSDVNLKTDIEDAAYGLDFVKGLRPRTFKWTVTLDEDTGTSRAGLRTHHGFIAQEVEAFLGDDANEMGLWNNGHAPAVVAEREGDMEQEESWSPNLLYMEFIPILTKAVQELSTKLDAAEARLAALEA